MSYQWKEKWTGVVVCPCICFTSKLEVDYEAQRALFRHLIKCGASGIHLNGYGMEGEVTTREEKKNLIRIALEEAKGKIPICSSILPARSVEEGVELAKEMEKWGADVLYIVAPLPYLGDVRVEPAYAIEYHKAVAKAVNIPVVTHQVFGAPDEFQTEALAKLFKEIDSLVGIKLAVTVETRWHKLEADMRALQAIGRDNVALLSGSMFFTTWHWGADGAYTGFANFGCEKVVALYNEIKRGNQKTAKRLADEIYAMESVLYIHPLVNLVTRYKEAAHMVGLIPPPTHRSLVPLSDQEKKRLREGLINGGFLTAK